jgi:hypothetical protein
MNPVRKWIDTVLTIAREQAECNELNREILERLFLFGIELGQRKRLTPKERAFYLKTVATAEAFMAISVTCPQSEEICIDQMIEDCVDDWSRFQPGLKRLLERLMKCSLDHLNPGPAIWPRAKDWFADQLKAAARHYPQYLSAREIPEILERLEHPLDRA